MYEALCIEYSAHFTTIQEIAVEYKVNAMPTFIFIKNKLKVDEFCGANETKVREIVKKLIA